MWFARKWVELKIVLQNIWFSITAVPWFIRNLIAFTLASKQHVLKHVSYGDRPRNNMNIYLPDGHNNTDAKYPVVVFVHGGIWIQGDKVIYHKLGEHFRQHNTICVVANYTLYPKGLFEDMLDDMNRVIEWVVKNIDNYGGDTNKITLFGHSAGAHLIGLALVNKCNRERAHIKDGWSLKDIHAWIAMSGVYDLEQHYEYEKQRLVHIISPMWRAATSVERFLLFSPALMFTEPFTGEDHFPTCYLYHGGDDIMCPPIQTSKLADTLKKELRGGNGVRNVVNSVILEGFAHSDLITSFIGMNVDGKKMERLWSDIEKIIK
jgi:acetyl esterase/lipase